jgi:hypothetical protein
MGKSAQRSTTRLSTESLQQINKRGVLFAQPALFWKREFRLFGRKAHHMGTPAGLFFRLPDQNFFFDET